MPTYLDNNSRTISGTPGITFQIDQASIARARKLLSKYQGRSLEERMRRGTLQAGRLLVGPIRAGTPVGRTGNLRRSVKAWTKRDWGGRTLAAGVGPTARHRHLVIQPHRIVTPGGIDTGRMTTGNPFVDAAVAPRLNEAIRIVSEALFGP